MQFSNQHRAQVQKDFPGAKVPQIGKILGQRWTELKENDKKEVDRFQSLADADKKRYATELAQWEKAHPEIVA